MEDDIKCILQDKQFHLQLKSEQKEIIQNVLERKDSMAVLPTSFGKSFSAHFGQGTYVRSYMQIISHVFSKSRDKCLKMKVIWRNNRV
jgi:superfamily II DNA or RNA helicase